MKKNNFFASLKYKSQKFLSFNFCVIFILAIISTGYILLYIFDIQTFAWMYSPLLKKREILLSLTTGYIVSFFIYLLTVHIPNFKQLIANERVMCYYISNYRSNLIYSFGGLVYKFNREGKQGMIEIPEITKLFASSQVRDKLSVDIIKFAYTPNDNKHLAREFERLENSFQQIITYNALYKSQFAKDIYSIQTNSWAETIYIIKDEIQNEWSNYKNLNSKYITTLISKNFELVNKATKIDNLINRNYDPINQNR